MAQGLKITFLGTGTSAGVPMLACDCEVCTSTDAKDKRLRASILVQYAGKNIAIDAGPDFRYQMLRANVKQLDAIVFTHEHRDHTAGLDDVRAFNFIQDKPMDVFLHPRVLKVLKTQFNYIFDSPNYPGIPQINWHLIENEAFEVHGVPFLPIEVMHYKLPVFGFRIGDFSYITDANFISEQELQKLEGSAVLVLNALRHEEHISHFTVEQAVAIAKSVKANQTWFTHFSHQIGLHRVVDTSLPDGINMAWDGLSFKL